MKKIAIAAAALMLSGGLAFATSDFSLEPPHSMAGTAMPSDYAAPAPVKKLKKKVPVVETFQAPQLTPQPNTDEFNRQWEKNNGGIGKF